MKYYTYILQGERDGNYYVGDTKDINVRVRKHNSGNVTSTKNRRPFKLIYFEEYTSKQLAFKRKFEIKGMKGDTQFKAFWESSYGHRLAGSRSAG